MNRRAQTTGHICVACDLAKAEAFARSRCDRKKIEMLFAHLKCILRSNRRRLRDPSGAQFEFTLAAIAQNLRRLAKIVSSPLPAIALSGARWANVQHLAVPGKTTGCGPWAPARRPLQNGRPIRPKRLIPGEP